MPFPLLQAEQNQRFRDAWRTAGRQLEPRVSVSRSIFPVVSEVDRAYFGLESGSKDQVGQEAIAAAGTLLLTIPIQFGVDYNAHLLGLHRGSTVAGGGPP